jgi:hypothetical protein
VPREPDVEYDRPYETRRYPSSKDRLLSRDATDAGWSVTRPVEQGRAGWTRYR